MQLLQQTTLTPEDSGDMIFAPARACAEIDAQLANGDLSPQMDRYARKHPELLMVKVAEARQLGPSAREIPEWTLDLIQRSADHPTARYLCLWSAHGEALPFHVKQVDIGDGVERHFVSRVYCAPDGRTLHDFLDVSPLEHEQAAIMFDFCRAFREDPKSTYLELAANLATNYNAPVPALSTSPESEKRSPRMR